MIFDTMNACGAVHNSRRLEYRDPQGAMRCGDTVRLSIELGSGMSGADVRLRLWINDSERILPPDRADNGRFEFAAEMPEQPGLVWYYFIVSMNGETAYYGGSSGVGGVYGNEPPAYQITVYARDFDTPEWFRKSIMYQIFPDRFRRDTLIGGLERVEYHKLLGRDAIAVDDWSKQPMYQPLEGRENYSPCDYYGGTLDGITDALDYLNSLGVGVIYLNPIFEAASNHRYNTADYKKIDPVLGDEDSLVRLCERAKELGIRVMLDGVFSHTGDDSKYFDRYSRYNNDGAFESDSSPYYDWYSFKSWPVNYDCWWGFQSLPEVKEMQESYIDYIAGENGVLSYWFERGVSSWRLDVADELPDDFIRRIRARLKHNDPEAVLLGEVWEDATNKFSMGMRRGYPNGDELDSVMNYPFTDGVLAFLTGRINAMELCARMGRLRESYPKPMYYALMNLIGSHDTVRALSVLCGAPGRDALPREEQAKIAFDEETLKLGKQRLRLAALMQMTAPGVPCIYYGDEAGFYGMADPFNRGAYLWGREDNELIASYRLLTHQRDTVDALKCGGASFLALDEDVFAILRGVSGGKDAFGKPAQDSVALAVINRSQSTKILAIRQRDFVEGADRIVFPGEFTDAVTKTVLPVKDGEIDLVLRPLCGILLTDGLY